MGISLLFPSRVKSFSYTAKSALSEMSFSKIKALFLQYDTGKSIKGGEGCVGEHVERNKLMLDILYNRQRAFDQAEGIYDILRDIFRRSKNDDITTNEASDLQAEDRIMKMARLKTFYNRKKKSVFKIK